MIQVNKENYFTNSSAEFDFITVESEGFLYVGVILDKLLKCVTVVYIELEDKLSYIREDFEDSKEVILQNFSDVAEAEKYFNEIRKPFKILHLVNKHKRNKGN